MKQCIVKELNHKKNPGNKIKRRRYALLTHANLQN
jgi:hypothetical protein